MKRASWDSVAGHPHDLCDVTSPLLGYPARTAGHYLLVFPRPACLTFLYIPLNGFQVCDEPETIFACRETLHSYSMEISLLRGPCSRRLLGHEVPSLLEF